MKQPLIELASGAWIDPTNIDSIRPAEQTESYGSGGIIPARVIIRSGDEYNLVSFEDESLTAEENFAAARSYARELATQANAQILALSTCIPYPSDV